MQDKELFMRDFYEERIQTNLDRKVYDIQATQDSSIVYQGKEFINLSSNDYLGLARNPLLHERGTAFQQAYGNGAAASRLVTGSFSGISQVEKKLANLKQKPRALLLASGYQANVSLLAALSSRKSLFLLDRLAHHSLLQGVLAGEGKLMRFRHNDTKHLASLLEKHASLYERVFIVTESVFSMDGDIAPLDAIIELKEQYNAYLYLDEAHATGVLGKQGMGLGVGKKVEYIMGTCSKALGSFGAYVACSEVAYHYFLQTCGGVIYSTALPPYVVGCIDQALDLIPSMNQERAQLQANAGYVATNLRDIGYTIPLQETQIIPVLIGDTKEACAFSAWLKEQGFWVVAIRPPTVPLHTARLRIAISCFHSQKQLDSFIALCKIWKNKN